MVADPVHGTEAARCGWVWRTPRRGEHFRTCSWCGSVHPDDLAAEIDLGLPPGEWGNLRWADRKYGWPHKLYVEIPNRVPDTLFCLGSSTRDEGREGWVSSAAVTPEQQAAIERNGMGVVDRSAYLFGTRPTHSAKFYSTHLADPGIGAAVLDSIARASGLLFRFEDGRVSWGPVEGGGS